MEARGMDTVWRRLRSLAQIGVSENANYALLQYSAVVNFFVKKAHIWQAGMDYPSGIFINQIIGDKHEHIYRSTTDPN